MQLAYELLIGLRYTRARRRNHFISFISTTSMLGIALGVVALITVLSVMNGFQQELRSRILGVAAHIQVSGPGNQLADWRKVAGMTEKNPHVLASAPYVDGQSMLSFNGNVQGVMVRGVLPTLEDRVADIGRYMKLGRLQNLRSGEFGIVLGADLAYSLQAKVGDKIVCITPQGLVGPTGVVPRLKQFTVVGIFQAGMYEYDATLALMHLDDAARLYRTGDSVSGLRLKLRDLSQAPQVAIELTDQLAGHGTYWVTNWTQQHVSFFNAVQLEKRVMFIILLLIVAVAAFNIVSTLVMVVTDKRADIAILLTLGARPRSLLWIFMIQGALIGLIGTALGLFGGIALALNIDVVVPFVEHLFGVQFLARDVYYISELPSQLLWSDVLFVAVVSFGLSLLATIYPSLRATKVDPVEALRYE